MNTHKWYLGKVESYGNYKYIDDSCNCGCERRTVIKPDGTSEIESYTLNHTTTINEPECTYDGHRHKAIDLLCRKLKKGRKYIIDRPHLIDKKIRELKGLNSVNDNHIVSTRYWNEADGVCSLSNPIVFNNLKPYVYFIIKKSPFITKKNFIEAEEVLLSTMDSIKDIPLSDYGSEEYTPIQWLCKKVATQIGREWWKYLKSMQPETYDRLKAHTKRG